MFESAKSHSECRILANKAVAVHNGEIVAIVWTSHDIKVTSNCHLEVLQSKGVRAFMSRAPEQQLACLVASGLHE